MEIFQLSFQIKVYIRGEKVVQMMRGSYDVSVAENGGTKNLTATDRYSSVFDHNGVELHMYKVGVMWLCLEVEQFHWRMCFDHGECLCRPKRRIDDGRAIWTKGPFTLNS